MGGLGARPVGHADPDDDEGPQVPVTPPAPTTPPVSSPRLTDWWRTGRPHIGAPAPVQPDDDQDAADEVDEDEDDEPEEEKPTAAAPVEKVATDSRGRATRRKTSVHGKAETAVGDRRMRIVAFNLTAGAVGYSMGLVDLVAGYLAEAERAAVGTFGLALAAAGAWGAWRASGVSGVRAVFRERTPFLRVVVTAGAAGIGHQMAFVPVAYLNQYGQEWGLGPGEMGLLVTAGGICGLLWWFVDRRLRPAHWVVRWLFRIPLASALLATALHTGTPVA